MDHSRLSPGKKAQHTARWARTMTKWLITFSHRSGSRWNLVEFGGKTKAESRGIVDLIAVRKNRREEVRGLKRGDLFEIVLIQTKGGSAPRQTAEDVIRLSKVARHHRARSIVLAEWNKGKRPKLFSLEKHNWVSVTPAEVFG